MCFSLISRLIGQITAPMRQTPSQISSFSRYLVRQQQHPVAFADAVALEIGGDVGGDLIELTEGDTRSPVEIDDRGLLRIARAVFRQQIGHRLIRNAELMIAEYVCHGRLPVFLLLDCVVGWNAAMPRRPLSRLRVREGAHT